MLFDAGDTRTIRNRLQLALGLVCLLAITAQARELPSSFQQAAALANAQESAPATRDYFRRKLLPYYSQKYAEILGACFTRVANPDSNSFSFVAAIASDGRVLRIYSEHETNIFDCMRESLTKETFPRPPVVPYYLHIDMDFKHSEE